MNIAETERLILRELNAGDAESFYLLNLDPEVIKYTGDSSFSNIAEARVFLENYTHYKKYGYGRWAVIDQRSHDFLGWCGLKYTPASNQTDIGFRFFRKYWGNGYASEATEAALRIGFLQYHLKQIVGRAMKDNLASIHVLKKSGLLIHGSFDFDGQEGVLYEISNFNDKA